MAGNDNRQSWQHNDQRMGGKPEPKVGDFKENPVKGNFVQQAEDVMKEEENRKITTTKLRSIYSLILDIYNIERLSDAKKLKEENKLKLQMAKVRIAYEVGRDERVGKEKISVVNTFVKNAKLIEAIRWIENNDDNSRENFMNFARYMEALVAYHRFYGGK